MNDRNIAGTKVGPLLDALADALPGAEGVILLSTDGVELAMSTRTSPALVGNLAAVASGLHAIADAANRNNGGRRVDQTVLEMDYRVMVVLPVAEGALLAVLFDAVADLSGWQERISWYADRLGLRLAGADLVPDRAGLVPDRDELVPDRAGPAAQPRHAADPARERGGRLPERRRSERGGLAASRDRAGLVPAP